VIYALATINLNSFWLEHKTINLLKLLGIKGRQPSHYFALSKVDVRSVKEGMELSSQYPPNNLPKLSHLVLTEPHEVSMTSIFSETEPSAVRPWPETHAHVCPPQGQCALCRVAFPHFAAIPIPTNRPINPKYTEKPCLTLEHSFNLFVCKW